MNLFLILLGSYLCFTHGAVVIQDGSNKQQPDKPHTHEAASLSRQLLQDPPAELYPEGAAIHAEAEDAVPLGSPNDDLLAAAQAAGNVASVPLPVAPTLPDSAGTDDLATKSAQLPASSVPDSHEVMLEQGIALHTATLIQAVPAITHRINRCGTPALPKAAKASVEVTLQSAVLGASLDSVVVAGPTSPITVYWHILQAGGLGDVTLAMLTEQTRVLNAAYASVGIAFRSPSSSTVFRYSVGASMFNATNNSTQERDFKTRFRKGAGRDLNIYSWLPGDGTLGWATFPFNYNAAPKLDGVVVSWLTVPGVCTARATLCSNLQYGPYSRGDTAVHEVRLGRGCENNRFDYLLQGVVG
jgi:hypothetical protein